MVDDNLFNLMNTNCSRRNKKEKNIGIKYKISKHFEKDLQKHKFYLNFTIADTKRTWGALTQYIHNSTPHPINAFLLNQKNS